MSAQTPSPVVLTRAGAVRGVWRPSPAGTMEGSAAFLGIPFAEPPVGTLRFAAPVPKTPWDGVLDATEQGPTPQRETLAEITLIPEPSVPGESTLNVNVFTPSPGDAAAQLPVLVYIHGGGFTAGSPASPWYDGAAFNRDGVVTVSISYRLGFDGFGWIQDAPHNRAVRDWLLALEWVQENIAAFGGDPAKVTIAGQSAGGAAVLTLLTMPAAQELFTAVYCISGPVATVTLANAEKFGKELAELAGVEPTRAGLGTIEEIRILEFQKKLSDPPAGQNPMVTLGAFIDGGLPWAPVVDGDLITRPAVEAIKAGTGAAKPLVMGCTDDEFSMIFNDSKNKMRFIPASFLLGKLGTKGQVRKDYLAANRGVKGTAAKVGRYLTDKMFRTATLHVAQARGDAPTWLYRFAWPTPKFHSAVHCLDVPFFFDCLGAERIQDLAGPNPPQALADDVHAGAVEFVKTGNPGWPRWTPSAGQTKLFDVPSSVIRNGYAEVKALL